MEKIKLNHSHLTIEEIKEIQDRQTMMDENHILIKTHGKKYPKKIKILPVYVPK